MRTLKALGECIYTQYTCQAIEQTRNIYVLANNAWAYLTYTNFNFLEINNKDGENI